MDDGVPADNPRPVIGVLALQGDVREHVRMLESVGARAIPVRRVAELSEVDGIVLPGGESTTMSRLLESGGLLEPLRTEIASGLPAFGSCAGMILLAKQVLDGRPDQRQLGGLDVVVRRNAFGRQVESFETNLAFAGLEGGPLPAVFIRAPWVEKVGPEVEVLAEVPGTSGALGTPGTLRALGTASGGAVSARIVAVRQAAVLATAFHPELTGDTRVHRLFIRIVQDADRRTGGAQMEATT